MGPLHHVSKGKSDLGAVLKDHFFGGASQFSLVSEPVRPTSSMSVDLTKTDPSASGTVKTVSPNTNYGEYVTLEWVKVGRQN